MSGASIDVAEPLARWLEAHLPGARHVEVGEEVKRAEGSGFSATTIILPIRYERDGAPCQERIVLRMEPPEEAIYPQQAPGLDVEIDIQYRTMQVLGRVTSTPLPPLLGYEADADVLGAPFYVMGFIDGQVPVENPPYVREGFYADAKPEQRRQMQEEGLRALAGIHAADWTGAGLDWLVAPGVTPDSLAQVDIWETYGTRELRGREHPLLERGFAWLRAHPPGDSPPAISWGDARMGNIIWRDFRCGCVTDFENVAIAPPEVDLGWWLMFDHWSHETQGLERLPGELTRDEQRAFYAECAGREVPDTHWHEVFGAVRYSAIVVRVMNRMVARGQLPADQQIWLQNPAATCLEMMLAEIG